MKILGFEFGANKAVEVQELGGYQAFSTPFLKVGKGDLSLPYVNARLNVGNYVRFGNDNLYPQLLNQMYYTSPLHGAIVDFKTNATVGGGYELQYPATSSAMEKVDIYAFEKRMNLKKILPAVTKEKIIHGRVYFHLRFNQTGTLIFCKHIAADKVRKNATNDLYYICDDWSTQINIQTIKPYRFNTKDLEFLYCYEDYSVGQDVYTLPQYSSCMNWAFLDGEMSYLQKSNIQNSIFPSFAMMFPKKPQTDEEKDSIKTTIERAKGATNAGKAIAFFANNKESLPTIEAIPTNSNDNLFQVTTESIDSKICQAHIIDPILMGIRVSGKLGSGSDIKQSYVIFEKNSIIPLRNSVEEIFNEILAICNINAKLVINNFQIVNDTIVEMDERTNEISNIIANVNPALATKLIDSMTQNELRELLGLKPIETPPAL
jgi:hypothetical protein